MRNSRNPIDVGRATRARCAGAAVRCVVPLLVCVLAGAPAHTANLLANPGFEKVTGTQPAEWNLFVAPKEGAFGRLSDTAHEGEHAVMLHTPTPYVREPVNNWSQNIAGRFGGATLRVSAWVRVRDAGEAAVWLQCWRRTPWGLVASADSADATPVYGTADWQEVNFTLEVPRNTDFLTVRCVLKGTGTAWFDALRVEKVEEDESKNEAPETTRGTDGGKDTVPHPDRYETQAPAAEAPYPTEDRDARTRRELEREAAGQEEARRLAADAATEALRQKLRGIERANLLMAEELERLREEKVDLVEELLELNLQLERLRDDVNALGRTRRPEETAAAGAEDGYAYPVPPLVPHGEDWRKYR